jgi:hypothetical protein
MTVHEGLTEYGLTPEEMVAQALQLIRDGLFESLALIRPLRIGGLAQYEQPNRPQSNHQHNLEQHYRLTPMSAPIQLEASQPLRSHGRGQHKKIPGSDGAERATI